ncbi:MAG: TetR/AcrR family transcriptional regulator [Oscillospiraceae bacterium]|nr:TetR/AcrR family transcriptional regulator [Oscillospiraceae bacterium]
MAILNNKPTKRSINAQNTKSKLLATSISLFAQYGFDKVTVEDITNVAGLSKGTFYVYFKSKESILIEEFRMIDHQYETVMPTLPDTASGTERILTLIKTMSRYCVNDVGLPFMKIVYANQIGARENRILNDNTRSLYKFARQAVQIGKARGEFPDIPDDEFTELIIRWARSILYDWCLYDGSFNLETEADKYFSILLSSLRALAVEQRIKNP